MSLAWYKARDKVGPYEDSNDHFKWHPKIDSKTGEQAFYYENIAKLPDSNEIDTSNFKSIRIDKDEAVVEMYGKYEALDKSSQVC